MKNEIRALWCKDSETGQECLIDLDTSEVLLRRLKGVTLPPEPTIRLAIRIVDTVGGYRIDIKYPQKAHYDNPETYTEALAMAARVITAEAKIEMAKLQGGSMEVL